MEALLLLCDLIAFCLLGLAIVKADANFPGRRRNPRDLGLFRYRDRIDRGRTGRTPRA